MMAYGTATYHYQPFPDLCCDMPEDNRSDGDLDRQLSTWIYQSAEDVAA